MDERDLLHLVYFVLFMYENFVAILIITNVDFKLPTTYDNKVIKKKMACIIGFCQKGYDCCLSLNILNNLFRAINLQLLSLH